MATKDWADLFGEELYGVVVEFARLKTLQIIDHLAEEGPAWSGQFRDSWRADPKVRTQSGRANPKYPYELRDIPRPAYDVKNYRKRTQLFDVVNTSPHKLYAMDAKQGTFYPPSDQPDPIKERVVFGKRARKGFRAGITPNDELDEGERPGTASATAEDGWFQQAVEDLPAIMKDRKAEMMSKARRTMREKMRRRRAK